MFHLPVVWQRLVAVDEHIEEVNQVLVVPVLEESHRILADLVHHVFERAVRGVRYLCLLQQHTEIKLEYNNKRRYAFKVKVK